MYGMGKRIAAILLSIICLVGIAVPQSAFGAQESAERKIRIGYIDYEHFISQDEDDNYVGYGVEFLNEIAEYTGWEYEYVYDSWENQLKNLKTGKIDFVCHAQRTKEREAEYLLSKYSIGSESSVLYIRMDDERYYYNDFAHFDGMTIAFLKDSFQNKEFSEYAQNKNFSFKSVEYENQEECFAALESGEVDGVAAGSLALKKEYKSVCQFGADPFYFMTAPENQNLMYALNDALGQIMAVGSTFQSGLYEKYYGSENTNDSICFTREEAEYIASAGPISISLIPNRKPFSYMNEDGTLHGITVDVMNLIEEKSGLQFSYSMMEQGTRTTAYLAEQQDTIIAGIMAENPEFASEDYLVSDIYYSDDVSLACLSGTNYSLEAKDAFYKLAIPKSYAALQFYIEKNYPQFEIILENNIEDCLKKVKNGEVDFTAQNVNVIKPYLQNPHYEKITVLPTFFMNEEMGIVANNTEENQILIGIIDKCIATINEKELSQFTVDHTIANGYRLTWGDMLYKFRYPVVVMAILLLFIISLMAAFIVLRKRSYRRLEEKNMQLADAVSQADNANRAKSMFLARMSHEIRTPMNAIVGLTALAGHYKNEPERVTEYLDKINISSKVLLNIINDVLDMSAIESNKIKIAEVAFDLQELLASISAVYYTQCKQKKVAFEMDTSEVRDEKLIGDGLRLNQILLNLVSNAYKFTPSGGKISITVLEAGEKAGKVYYKFMVADTGEGMTKELLSRLFQPFEQEGAETAQKHGGSGLGLSIAKNLVDLMGGSISCTSEKGVGTTFAVSLPFQLDKTEYKNQSNEILSKIELRALIVDDESDARDYIGVILERIGVPYTIAVNGGDAVDKIKKAKEEQAAYDICFIDWKMPEVDGSEVTKTIRRLYDKDTIVIIVSAYDTEEVREQAKVAGADMLLAKPVFQSTIFNLLMKMSGGRYVKLPEKQIDYDFSGYRVLLVEDTKMNAEIAIDLLQLVNMQADHAWNGQEAVEMFAQNEPGTYAAILMDVQMPVMNGYEATKAIRGLDKEQADTIPIIAMTANAFSEDVSAALNAGMNGHIAKPIDTQILYQKLYDIIQKKSQN